MVNCKKVMVFVMCSMLVLTLLAGCGSSSSSSKESEKAQSSSGDKQEQPKEDVEEKKLRIFFTNAFYTAPYCAPLNEEAKKTADAMGVELQIVDGKGDAQVQLDQIQNAILQEFDGIMYFPADMASSVNIVRKIKDSGIPFVIVNSQVDSFVQDLIGTFVGPDPLSQGRIAAQMAIEALGADGGNVVFIEGAGGSEGQIKRSEGFEEVLKDNPQINILGKQQADWDPAKAMKVMEDFLTKFGDKIDLVYTHDDGMFQGVAKVLKDKGLTDKVKVVSIGANRAGVAAVKAGELYGTASQSPQEEGRKGVEAIIKVINGEKLDPWIKTESVPVTSKNVDEFGDAGW